MRKRLLLASLAVAVALPLMAWQAGSTPDPSAGTDLKDLEAAMAKMLVQGDVDQYASRLTDDYVYTGTKGQTQAKQEVLADLRSPDRKILDVLPEELQVHNYGDAAVLTGHLSVLRRQNGRVTTTFTRFTQCWIKRDGRWLLIATQETAVLK